jgi:chloride channel 3/4/5
MADSTEPNERTRLLSVASIFNSRYPHDVEAHSHISSAVSKEEEALGNTAVGEILPYNDYSSIDFLHDLVRILSVVMIIDFGR